MALGNRYSQHSFAQIPDVKMARSQFDRSFTQKDTFDFDYLVPCFVDEILPGDTASVNMSVFARLATQKVPIMDNMMIDFFFFFVPNRLVWDNWERFNGAQDNPGDNTDFIVPTIEPTDTTGEPVGSLWDKFGLPTQIDDLEVIALPFRMYNLIYNTWFRSQDLQDSLPVPKDNGPDDITDYVLKKRTKRHDYFTSCSPEPQKGTAVSIPFANENALIERFPNAPAWDVFKAGTDTPQTTGNLASSGLGNLYDGVSTALSLDPAGGLYAQLGLSQITVNALRLSIAVQSILELDARGGTRYVEVLQNHFNVTSPDFRLQRPEYLGGGQAKINSHPVAQTSPTAGSNAQAQLAAFATASSSSIGFSKSFVEHGWVIGLMCARADITYQQGIERMWSRQKRFDYFWPKLQEVGEMAVLNKEIFAQGVNPADASVFGYQEQYADYRYKPSQIKGEFRSTFAQSLDMWHMAEEFSALPQLNDVFIEQATPIERALAVTGAPHLLIDIWCRYKHARPMLTYAVPSTLGRF
nr:MAG: major capsid protein [Microvirus sp.]